MADGIYVNTDGILNLASHIKRAADEVVLEAAATLATEAEALAREASTIAASYPATGNSPSTGAAQAVADSVKARRRTKREWVITAGTVLAGLWEYGNKGSSKHATTFRHPVFGRREDWEAQPKWPFLRMAVDRHFPVSVTAFRGRIYNVLRRNFR